MFGFFSVKWLSWPLKYLNYCRWKATKTGRVCQDDRKVHLTYYRPLSSLQPTLRSLTQSVFSDESEVTVDVRLLSFSLHRLGKQRRRANVWTSHLEQPEHLWPHRTEQDDWKSTTLYAFKWVCMVGNDVFVNQTFQISGQSRQLTKGWYTEEYIFFCWVQTLITY